MKTATTIILALLIIVGIFVVMPAMIGYFSVLHVGETLPDRCTSPPQFTCEDWEITEDEVVIDVRNERDYLVVHSVVFESEEVIFSDCTAPQELTTGDLGTISCPIESGAFGGKAWVRGQIIYQPVNTTDNLTANIELFASP